MKFDHLFYPLAVLLLTTGCQSKSCQEDILCETYVHRYGVPLNPEDWSSRGQHGQVLSTRKDGVIVAKTYESGILHGETSYTFPHQDIVQKREYYDQGCLKQEVWNHVNGIPHRQVLYHTPASYTHVTWYEDGVPQCKEQYESERLVEAEYFNPTNQVESSVNEGQGMRIRRDSYGQLLSVDNIQSGQMVQSTTYHANGTPESLTPYRNERAEGLRQTFYPNGEPHTIEEWKLGVQSGNTIVFQNGEKLADVPYRNGSKNGIERRYRNGKDLAEEISWVKDQRQGPCYSYAGSEKKTTWYVQNKEVNKATYDVFIRQQ